MNQSVRMLLICGVTSPLLLRKFSGQTNLLSKYCQKLKTNSDFKVKYDYSLQLIKFMLTAKSLSLPQLLLKLYYKHIIQIKLLLYQIKISCPWHFASIFYCNSSPYNKTINYTQGETSPDLQIFVDVLRVFWTVERTIKSASDLLDFLRDLYLDLPYLLQRVYKIYVHGKEIYKANKFGSK